MNNLSVALKRFLSNKNTVTILGVLLAIFILYTGYNNAIKSKINPQRIPYAKVTIQPHTKITKEMIGYIEVAPAYISNKKVITDIRLIEGYYTNYNTLIPQGSVFFEKTVVKGDTLPDSIFRDVPAGYVIYPFSVNIDKTYGNSFFPGNSVDIYIKILDDNNQVMVGRLIKDVKIKGIKDANGLNVFDNSDETRKPAYMYLEVTDEMNLLLRKVSYLKTYSAEIFLTAANSESSGEGGIKVTSTFLQEYINRKTALVPEENLEEVQ